MRVRVVSGVLGLFAVGLGGCGPNVKAIELRQANQAKARGDFVEAAEHLQRACAADPKDKKVCAQAVESADAAVDDGVRRARTDLEQGRYPDALARLVKVRGVDRAGKTSPLLDELGEKLASQCESHAVDGLADAVRLVRCLETNRVALDRAAYSSRVTAGRQRAAEVAAGVAKASAAQDRPGSAYAQYGIAQCLLASPERAAARDQAYGAFYTRTSVPLGIRANLPWASPAITQAGFCAGLHDSHPIVTCSGTLGARTLGLDLTVGTSRTRHETSSEQREIEYVDHIETYQNPQWLPLQNQVVREQRSLQRDRAILDQASADCDTARAAWSRANNCNQCWEHNQRDSVCNRAEATRQTFNAHVQDVNQLENQLNGTPRELQREIRDVFRYTESTHRYSTEYNFTGSSISEGRTVPATAVDRVEYTAIEHVGFAKAGLAPSPLIAPTQQQFHDEITQRAADFARSMAERELQARGETKLASCNNPKDASQLDCWLEAQFLLTPDPIVPYTAVVASDVGQAFPPAGCK